MTLNSGAYLISRSPIQGEGWGKGRVAAITPDPALDPPYSVGSSDPLKGRGVRRAFTMVEAVFSVVLVGGLVVVSLDTLGASKLAQKNVGDRALGQLLASSLMSEILDQSYQDPNDTPINGLELTENLLLRTTFDDVDDYLNWTASPPTNRDGTTIPNLTGWQQSVKIEVVDPANLSTRRSTDTGVKRVTVTIKRNNVVVSTLVGVKTGAPNTLLTF